MKVLVSDVDGTIIHSYGHVTEYTKETLIKFQEEGNLIILASGRSYFRMMGVAKDIRLDKYGGYLIDSNGLGSYNFKNKGRKRYFDFSKDQIKELTDYFITMNVEIKFYFDDGIYIILSDDIYDLKKRIRQEMRLPEDYPWNSGVYSWFCDNRDGYPNQKLIRSVSEIDGLVNKIGIAHDNWRLQEVQKEFYNSDFTENYDLIFSADRQLDIIPKNLSKGIALNRLLKEENIEYEDLYIFGDSENDISMLDLSDNSYVMANAGEEVLNRGYKKTLSNDEDGLAIIAEKLLK